MTRRDKSPAFQWYPRDYLVDELTVVMTLEEEGAYRRLLDYCWLEGSLPDDLDALAVMCKGITRRRMEKLWERIRPCFRLRRGRWQHPRLDAERRKQATTRKARSDAGKKGATARHGSPLRDTGQLEVSHSLHKPGSQEPRHGKGKSGSATSLPVAKSSSASASASATAVEPPVGPPAGDAKPGRKVRLPDDWEPSGQHHERARAERVDCEREAEKFRSHHLAKGSRMLSWDQAFTTWLLKAGEYAGGAKNGAADDGRHWGLDL